MEWFIKAFIRASLLWFVSGIILGVAMAVHPAWIVYRPAHAHMNVAGFLTMLVFGVGYQLLPRLFGHPLHSRLLAIAHLFLANIGLVALILGFILGPATGANTWWLTATGGSLYAIGVLLWAFNLWRTFDAADALARERAESGKSPLPTVDS